MTKNPAHLTMRINRTGHWQDHTLRLAESRPIPADPISLLPPHARVPSVFVT